MPALSRTRRHNSIKMSRIDSIFTALTNRISKVSKASARFSSKSTGACFNEHFTQLLNTREEYVGDVSKQAKLDNSSH